MLAQQAVVGGERSGHPTEPQPTPYLAHPIPESQIPVTESSSPQNTQTPRQALHEHTEAATTASLEAQQDNGNISKTQSMATLNESTSQEEGSGSGPGRQETIGGAQAQTWSEGGRNNEKTEELNLTNEADTEVIVEDKGSGENGDSATDQVSTARPEVSTARLEVSAASVPVKDSAVTPSTPPTTTTVFDDEDLTIDQTLLKMRSEKAKEKEIAKEKGVAFRNVEEAPRLIRSITTLQPLPYIDPKDKGKGVLVEEFEKPEKIKRRDQGLAQIESDAELGQRLYQEDLAELERLQQEDKEQYTIEERAYFLVETIAAQRKFRAAQRAAEIRSKPPTKTQLRNMMITYIKNMDSALKQKSSKIQKMMQEQESAKSDEDAAADYEHEKEELRMWLTVVPDEEEIVDPEILLE
ncbi:hypothetical protein Tco_1453109 [Tanacetum coccineum]